MSAEKVKEFLERLQENAPDEALVEKWKSAKTEDERLQVYTEIAGSMGYDLSVADMKESLLELEAECKAKTQAAQQKLEALDDDELENVAGGEKGHEDCRYDFAEPNCVLHDACNYVNIIYIGY